MAEGELKLRRFFRGDKYLWGLIVLFMVVSLLSVYSSSVAVAYSAKHGNTFYFLRTQFIMLFLGLVIIVVTHWIPYINYMKYATLAMGVSIALLAVTLVAGVNINSASRWLVIPVIGLRIQPSDIAKVVLVIYLARGLTIYQNKLHDFKIVTLHLLMPVAVVCMLIMSENLSTALMIFAISMIILFVGRVPFKFLMAYAGMGLATVILFAALLMVIKKGDNRVEVWKNRIGA